MVCTNCYDVNEGKRKSGGGAVLWGLGLGCLLLAVFAWPLLLAAVAIGVVQHATGTRVCARCGGGMVEDGSPRGREIAAARSYHGMP